MLLHHYRWCTAPLLWLHGHRGAALWQWWWFTRFTTAGEGGRGGCSQLVLGRPQRLPGRWSSHALARCAASGRKSASVCVSVCTGKSRSRFRSRVSRAGLLNRRCSVPQIICGTAEARPGMQLLLRGPAALSGPEIPWSVEARPGSSRKPRREGGRCMRCG